VERGKPDPQIFLRAAQRLPAGVDLVVDSLTGLSPEGLRSVIRRRERPT